MTKPLILEGLLILAFAVLPGCGGKSGETSDAGDEDALDEEPPPCDPFPAPETGGNGSDLGAPPPPGQAQAGKIMDPEQVPAGLKAWAETGDTLIRNSRVGFVIEDGSEGDAYVSHGFGPYGGEIVYADFWSGEEEEGKNLFGELLFSLGLRMVDAESVSVMKDGTDGEAVVRVTGPLAPLPFLDVVAGDLLDPFPFSGEMVLDYILRAEDDFLQVRATVRNPRTQMTRIHLPMVSNVMGDGLKLFTPESGFDLANMGGDHAFIGFVGDEISYAYVDGRGGNIEYIIEYSNFLFTSLASYIEVGACGEVQVPAYALLVARGGAESLLEAARAYRGEAEPPRLAGTVTVEGEGPAAGARVHVLADDGAYVTSALCGGDGAYGVGLPPGTYEVLAFLEGHAPAGPRQAVMADEGQTLDLEIPQPGTLSYSVVDGNADPVPAKIIVFPESAVDPLPPSLGEATYPADAAAYVFSAAGSGEMPLPVGQYRVHASRGFWYEPAETVVDIAAGSRVETHLVLPNVVDTAGFLCGDFHQHSLWSADSNTPPETVLAANMAEGLQIVVSTDHDWIADYQPLVEELGLQAHVRAFGGEEITTFDYGHFNVFPVTVLPDARNHGAANHYYRLPGEVFGDALADPLGPLLQVNHPRASSVVGGYFGAVGLDPVTCAVENVEYWEESWSLVEVFNDSSFSENQIESGTQTVQDWFGLLGCGYRFTATGSSDTHDPVTSALGYPRNCLEVDFDDPALLTESSFKEALRDLKVLVSGGPFITIDIEGAGMGEVASAPGGEAAASIMVQAAEWMGADRLRIFVNGEEIRTITLDETTRDPANPVIRFNDLINVATGGPDGWLIAVVEGDAPLNPVVTDRMPFAATNPVFLDADGDGRFTP